jgi:hypothetical protein
LLARRDDRLPPWLLVKEAAALPGTRAIMNGDPKHQGSLVANARRIQRGGRSDTASAVRAIHVWSPGSDPPRRETESSRSPPFSPAAKPPFRAGETTISGSSRRAESTLRPPLCMARAIEREHTTLSEHVAHTPRATHARCIAVTRRAYDCSSADARQQFSEPRQSNEAKRVQVIHDGMQLRGRFAVAVSASARLARTSRSHNGRQTGGSS